MLEKSVSECHRGDTKENKKKKKGKDKKFIGEDSVKKKQQN